jgi:1,4-alpha-glucan branching enzyme
VTPKIARTELDELVAGRHANPHAVLGAHPGKAGKTGTARTIIRTLRPDATAVEVCVSGASDCVAMQQIHEGGIFEAVLDGPDTDYRIKVAYGGEGQLSDDPYRWLPTLGEVDLHLIGEGRHENLWDVLGAHVRSYDTPTGAVTGTSFAVWAPSARGVRLIGDFDFWSGRALPMRSLGASGVWELFVPGVGAGARYKFQILGVDGQWREKADPMAFATTPPPDTASMVQASTYQWGDADWLDRRARTA